MIRVDADPITDPCDFVNDWIGSNMAFHVHITSLHNGIRIDVCSQVQSQLRHVCHLQLIPLHPRMWRGRKRGERIISTTEHFLVVMFTGTTHDDMMHRYSLFVREKNGTKIGWKQKHTSEEGEKMYQTRREGSIGEHKREKTTVHSSNSKGQSDIKKQRKEHE